MKVLILNSGMGSRMDSLTKTQPKCMTNLPTGQTILSRQIKLLQDAGLKDIVITTGYYDNVLVDYCRELDSSVNFTFVNNPKYQETNYIYSIYCARHLLEDDLIMIHGDLIFDEKALSAVIENKVSCVVTDPEVPLPEKDFKAVVSENRVKKIGVEFFDSAVASQPLYKFLKKDWELWLSEIVHFCENGNVRVYAEKALNNVLDKIFLQPIYPAGLCREVDTPQDLEEVSALLNR